MKGNFQLITISVFIALAVFGVLVFSGAIPIGDQGGEGSLGTVTLWGTDSTSIMAVLLEDFHNANPTFSVQYVQKSPDTFDQDLLEALADGKGPDMIFLPDTLAFHYANKIFTIPYQSYPLATFKQNFAGAGEVFLTSQGMLAFPLSIDPLMMYYNRSQLDAEGVVYPPAFWDEVTALVPTLTKKDDSNKIIKSTVAMGHFSNVTHAKDIITTLLMQKGSDIVAERNGAIVSVLGESSSRTPLDSTLQFYIDFADPNKSTYSWNKSFPYSSDAFSAENLALYFGFSSELASLINRNPNQNFQVAPVPQNRNTNFKLTGAHVKGIAILSSSKNFNTAFLAASLMSTGDFAYKFSLATGIPPARRDLLAIKPKDEYSPIFYNSALFAKGWLDPSAKNTDDIFRKMIEGIISNNMSVSSALADANSKLGILLRR